MELLSPQQPLVQMVVSKHPSEYNSNDNYAIPYFQSVASQGVLFHLKQRETKTETKITRVIMLMLPECNVLNQI